MKTLAKIDVGEGREAAIFERDDGTTYWSPGFDMWLMTEPQPSFAAVPAGTLVAGEIPPGGVSVEVRGGEPSTETVVAGGRFLALLPGDRGHGQVFVLFRDENGELVAPERGKELKREALEADVACPACGGRGWDRVDWRVPPDEGGGRKRAVVCRACGHAPLGVGIVERRRADEPAYEEDPSPLSDEPTAAEIVRVAPFPVYVASAGRPALSQTSWSAGEVLAVVLATGVAGASVEVTSAGRRVPPEDAARGQLSSFLRQDLPIPQDLDPDVRQLKRAEMVRRLTSGVTDAPVETIALELEGEAVEVSLVEHGGAWAASTGTVTVKGRNVAPAEVALRRLRPGDELATYGDPGCS
ncbi:MAG: hypothetical protein QOC55_2724 [Thermoleophilaceae bacterium]|nr:hypothetical protein [Thermoleophilaceae bacterium]